MPSLEFPSSVRYIYEFGGYGVPLFYILSAFVLCYGYFGNLNTRSQVIDFYVRRFFRIAPFYYFMMAIFFAWHLVVFNGYVIPLDKMFISATFLFNLVPGYAEGVVWASWSIGVEMLFYAIFPLVSWLAFSLGRSVALFATAVCINAAWRYFFIIGNDDKVLASFATSSIFNQLHYFAAGVVAFWAWKKWNSMVPHRLVIAAALFCIGLLATFAPSIMHYYSKVFGAFWATAFAATWAAALALLVAGFGFDRFRLKSLAWTAKLGEASFSIYLWHPLVIGSLNMAGAYKWLYASLPGVAAPFFASAALTFAIVLPLSSLSYEFIEKRASFMLRRAFVNATKARPPITI